MPDSFSYIDEDTAGEWYVTFKREGRIVARTVHAQNRADAVCKARNTFVALDWALDHAVLVTDEDRAEIEDMNWWQQTDDDADCADAEYTRQKIMWNAE